MIETPFEAFTEPGDLVHVASTEVCRGKPLLAHGHGFAEVFWISQGRGIHGLNAGEEALHPNQLVFVRPGDRHHCMARAGERLVFMNLALPWSGVQGLADRYFGGEDAFWRGSYRLGQEQRIQLDRLAAGVAGHRANRLLADQLLVTLLSFLPNQEIEKQLSVCPDWLMQACQRMAEPEHFCHGAGVLSQLTGRSQEHVARTLKKYAGLSPGELVTAYRLRYAAAMLRTSDCPILDIAIDCGFQSLSHFYRIFRKRFGVPPRTYRLGNRTTLPTSGREAK